MLLHELAAKGIAPDVADAATAAVQDDDTAAALAQRKAATLRARPPDEVAKKVSAFLVRKGYSRGLAARMAQSAAEASGNSA